MPTIAPPPLLQYARARAAVLLLTLLLSLGVAVFKSLAVPGVLFPHAVPICAPSGTADRGLFGFSVDLVAAEGYMWLAVGEPWLLSVHVYRAPLASLSAARGGDACISDALRKLSANLTVTSASSNSSAYTMPNQNDRPSRSIVSSSNVSASAYSPDMSTFVNNAAAAAEATAACPDAAWEYVASIRAAEQLPPEVAAQWQKKLPLSAFGFSVSWSLGGEYLAIGAPAAGSPVSTPALAPYHGAVRVFRRTSTNFLAHTMLDAASGGNIAINNDRFGSRVAFARPAGGRSNSSSSSSSSDSGDRGQHFLFIVSNGGWDGVSAPGVARSSDGVAPQFGGDTASGLWPAQPTTSLRNNGVYVFKQIKSPNDGQRAAQNQWRFVQFLQSHTPEPFGMLGIEISAMLDGDSLPLLVARDQIANTSSVVVYEYNRAKSLLEESAVIRSPEGANSAGVDWFGAGIALSTAEGIPVLHVGSPRTSSPVARFVSMSSTWIADSQSLAPPVVSSLLHQTRSFFGGTLASYGDTLLVSDAVSPDAVEGSGSGKGSVYLVRRRIPGFAILGYEDVQRTAVASAGKKSSSSVESMPYDWIARLVKTRVTGVKAAGGAPGGSSAPPSTSMGQDQFGKSVAIFNQTFVVGAPVEGCVYLYTDPFSYSVLTDSKTNLISSSTQEYAKIKEENSEQTKIYIAVGASLAVLIVVPIFVYLMIVRHKRKVRQNFSQGNSATGNSK